jgi:hypothetical protein
MLFAKRRKLLKRDNTRSVRRNVDLQMTETSEMLDGGVKEFMDELTPEVVSKFSNLS